MLFQQPSSSYQLQPAQPVLIFNLYEYRSKAHSNNGQDAQELHEKAEGGRSRSGAERVYCSGVGKEKGIPDRTLERWVQLAKDGGGGTAERLGPRTRLSPDAEETIYQWIIARQMVGAPVGRLAIIRKTSEVAMLVDSRGVGDGWYRRFVARHPSLSNRRSQAVTKSRNAVTDADVEMLFWSIAKVIIEHDMDASRIFDVDETAFESGKKSANVIALRGSLNVWHTDPSIHFHLSFVACGGANGFVVPPLFVLPGERVENYILEGCAQLPGAAVTSTDSAFMNAKLFVKWLGFFASSVPASVKRPLLLLMDGCSSHISPEIVDTAERHQVILICLPANCTHLLQPLDIAVFSSFKLSMKTLIEGLVTSNREETISKPRALEIASLAWITSNVEGNIASGFVSCGIFPLSMVCMMAKLTNFVRNGVSVSVQQAAWLRVKDAVQHDVLTLPPPRKTKTRKRKMSRILSLRWIVHRLWGLIIRLDYGTQVTRSRLRNGCSLPRNTTECPAFIFTLITFQFAIVQAYSLQKTTTVAGRKLTRDMFDQTTTTQPKKRKERIVRSAPGRAHTNNGAENHANNATGDGADRTLYIAEL